MTTIALARWLSIAVLCTVARAQLPAPAAEPEVVLSTRFLAPISYETALTRLGNYYYEQVGRILPLSFPEIAAHRHFEVWHDIWVSFDAAQGGVAVTLKRPTEGTATHLIKSWMLDLAGRLEAPMPLVFQTDPALRRVESDIYASYRDLGRAMQSEPSMKLIPTWQHAGLMVSAAPLRSVVLAPIGVRGVHHVAVSAESLALAKQLLAKLQQAVLKPGIYAAYSEEAELDQEVRDSAGSKAALEGIAASQALYVPNVDEKHLEDRLRAEPEMAKRSAAALGQYAIRMRLDKNYHRVIVTWSELTGYVRVTGKYQTERSLGQAEVTNSKVTAPAVPSIVRTRLPVLQPGAYRIRLMAQEASAGDAATVDQRIYWFNGKTFEEL